MNIFVSNLNFKVKEGQLKDLFAQYGEVKSVKIVTDRESGKSRGFGFVEMDNDDEAQTAIDCLDNSNHEGRDMKVVKAKPREVDGNRTR